MPINSFLYPAPSTPSFVYNVANSCRFDGSSSYMSRTHGTPTNAKKHTFSAWVKMNPEVSSHNFMFGVYDSPSQNNYYWRSASDDRLSNENSPGGSGAGGFYTSRAFKDPSSWYHIVVAEDTTQATDTNRVKVYVNGVQETAFDTMNYIAQDANNIINSSGSTVFIGQRGGSYGYLDGYMAEMVFIDGQQLDPTSFGEFDSDSPNIWKPIDVSGLTFGNNGFYLDFENASSLGADVSGNSNNFTTYNLATTDQSTDTCTNNFAIMNSVANYRSGVSFSEGNLNIAMTNNKGGSTSTFGLTTGKWYVEMNITTMPADERFHLGIAPFEIQEQDDPISTNNQGLAISGFNAVIYADSGSGSAVLDNFFGNNTTRFDSFTGIIGMALDMTNGTIAFSKAGAWITGSGTTDTDFSNASKVNISTPLARHDVWHIVCGSGNGSGTTGVYSMNFGSPSFSISSGNADDNGYGNFEYDVPAGYYAINSKNLAEFG